MAGSEKKKDSEKVESTTLLHYTHISAGLPDTGTRPTGLVNLKAPMEVGWLAGVCQEEAAGTSRSGHREADKSGERIQRRQQFLLPLPPPRFLWCNLTPRGAPASRHTHREPVPDLSCTNGCLSPFCLRFLSSLFFGII